MTDTSLSSNFLPQGYCFHWQAELVWINALAEMTLALAYCAVPVIVFMVLRRHNVLIPFRWVFIVFGLSIMAGGLTHLLSLIGIWHAFYHLEGVIKIVAAALSMASVLLLVPALTAFIDRGEGDAAAAAAVASERSAKTAPPSPSNMQMENKDGVDGIEGKKDSEVMADKGVDS